jgi:hypothetical protein
MYQTSLTRSVRSFSYNFSPVGWILQFSSSCITHQVNNFALHNFLWRLVYQGREHHCSACCYSSRCLFVSFVLQVSTHFSRYDFEFKTTDTTYRQYYGIDTWPRFWRWFLDHDKSHSDAYDNLTWWERTASSIQSKGIHTWSKDQADGGAAQDKKSNKTTSTYISRHFGMEKTDKCNELKDSSVHWWQKWWYTHVHFLDIIVLNSFLCTACRTKMTHRDVPCCGTWFEVRLLCLSWWC